VNNVEYLKQEI